MFQVVVVGIPAAGHAIHAPGHNPRLFLVDAVNQCTNGFIVEIDVCEGCKQPLQDKTVRLFCFGVIRAGTG